MPPTEAPGDGYGAENCDYGARRAEAASASTADTLDSQLRSEAADELSPLIRTAARAKQTDRPLIRDELAELVSFSLPVSAGYLLSYLNQTVLMILLGHIGAIELAAACLALTYSNVTSFSVGIGLATAMDTLCAQTFTGLQEAHAVGDILQRALFVMAIASIPMALLWLFSEPIMLSLGQEPEVVALSARFLKLLLPSLLPTLAFECLKRFLQAQGIASANTVVILATTILNLPLAYFLIWDGRGLGFLGAPLAMSIVAWANLALMLLYTKFVAGSDAWGGWSRKAIAWEPLKAYLALAIPAALQVCSEWWTFEVLAILAGLLGATSLSSQSILTTITSLLFMMPLGLSVATTTRVAQLLGSGKAEASKLAALCGLALSGCFSILAAVALFSARHHLGRLFTSDPDVIASVATVLSAAAVYEFFDALNCVAAGVLRGVGWNAIGAGAAFVGYYLIGLPLAAFLAFGSQKLGLLGIWMGITVGLALSTIIQLIASGRISFEEEVISTRRRIFSRTESSVLFSPGLGSSIARNSHSAITSTLNFTFNASSARLLADIDAAIASVESEPETCVANAVPPTVPSLGRGHLERILNRTGTSSPLSSPTLGWSTPFLPTQ